MKLDNNWIGQMAKWTLSDPAALKMYLDIISKCPDYSVNNQLLLMYQSQERPFKRRTPGKDRVLRSTRQPVHIPSGNRIRTKMER